MAASSAAGDANRELQRPGLSQLPSNAVLARHAWCDASEHGSDHADARSVE